MTLRTTNERQNQAIANPSSRLVSFDHYAI